MWNGWQALPVPTLTQSTNTHKVHVTLQFGRWHLANFAAAGRLNIAWFRAQVRWGWVGVWGSMAQSTTSSTWVMLNSNFFINWIIKFHNLCRVLCSWVLPSHTTRAGPCTLPLSPVRPTKSWVLSGVICVVAHTSAGRPLTLPWPDLSWNTVPAFGILSSSTTLTPLISYREKPLDGREASMVPPASPSS